MRSVKQKSRLIVEGQDDLFSVVGLMRAHVNWPQELSSAPVFIDVGKSVSEILEKVYLTTMLKSPEINTLGIMLDADDNPAGRYQSFHGICKGEFPSLPERLNSSGVIVENEYKKRLGFWIMPDNESPGYLETFLKTLVPDQSEDVWNQAVGCVREAKPKGAPYREIDIPKVNLYTWLAWQDPPGQSPGLALTKKILDPKSTKAAPFVAWFRQLYQL